ncbi:MAG TPA: 4-alpha-glucanotransferase, partial [Rikenellaceae bacterium]|nr:4-alpha-glucanotransferase [Rikenellaceae bacterium]
MKVLMFGWEFPPHISGGLGTACYGLTKGLANNGVEVLFVMPSATGDEDKSAVSIIDASEIEVSESCRNVRDFLEKVQFIRIGSNLIPYMDPQEFTEMLSNLQQGQIEEFKLGFGQKYKFSGKYGKTLMEEVVRYALVGAEIALRNDFDVIHAHDWLTYLA